MGKYQILKNIEVLAKIHHIESVKIPKELIKLRSLFDRYNIIEDAKIFTSEPAYYISNCLDFLSEKISTDSQFLVKFVDNNSFIRMPVFSIIYLDSEGKPVIDEIKYPWDFLKSIQKLLNHEITSSVISTKAKIANTVIIDGPCIIEKDVVIDDFVKIKGPCYIGSGSFIGMGSLIRNSILEQNTSIGFNCEIGKSYFAGHDKISHHNVILDSIVGENVWFGGFTGTANVLLNKRNIQYKINGELKDTGIDHFGSVIGDNCCIGASVIILPGRRIPSNTHIQAGTVFKS